jgi:hypothetical protein
MSINEKNFYDEVNASTKKAIEKLNELSNNIAKLQEDMKSMKYSYEHKQKVLQPELFEARRKYNSIKENVLYEFDRYANKLISAYKEEEMLNVKHLTDDAQLFQLGVKLPAEDVINIFNKHSGNPTMQKLIHEYVINNGYDKKTEVMLTPDYETRKQSVRNVKNVVEVVVKHHDKPELYEQFMGEGSELRANCYA